MLQTDRMFNRLTQAGRSQPRMTPNLTKPTNNKTNQLTIKNPYLSNPFLSHSTSADIIDG